jgi:hypothetical protein
MSPSSIFDPTGSSPALIGNIGFSNHLWNGLIDDARIYNRALSATEIASLYNAGR